MGIRVNPIYCNTTCIAEMSVVCALFAVVRVFVLETLRLGEDLQARGQQ